VPLVLAGTVIALIPNYQATKLAAPARARAAPEIIKSGETVGAGD
jgi:hypothetical protein